MLRSQESRAAAFWKGSDEEIDETNGIGAALADRILKCANGTFSGRKMGIEEISKLFAMDISIISRIVTPTIINQEIQAKKICRKSAIYWAKKRKADIERKRQNYQKLHDELTRQ